MAVLPPPEVLDLVAALERPPIEGLRWTTRDQWHVTLRFLGETEVAPVVAALSGVSAGRGRAQVGPTVGRFGRRILHLPVSGLDDMARDVIAATAALGRPPDDRPFHGHLTLARVAGTAKVDLRRLAGTPLQAAWDVESCCLMESRLAPAGARYQLVERFEV